MRYIEPSRPSQGGRFALNHAAFHPGRGQLVAQQKYDGYRCVIQHDGCFSRHGKVIPTSEHEILRKAAKALQTIIPDSAVGFDCELLGARKKDEPSALVIFDLIIAEVALVERLLLLEEIGIDHAPLEGEIPFGVFLAPSLPLHTPDDEGEEHCAQEAWEVSSDREGIVIKRADASYAPGTTTDWVKFRYEFPGNGQEAAK